jgi:hypothetical protein
MQEMDAKAVKRGREYGALIALEGCDNAKKDQYQTGCEY